MIRNRPKSVREPVWDRYGWHKPRCGSTDAAFLDDLLDLIARDCLLIAASLPLSKTARKKITGTFGGP
jgi:hypothetical protein